MASALPAPFGRYTLQKRIATGGMAEIYLAKQQGPGRFERSLVIKRILPHLVEDPKFTAMFLDEAALAAHLSHPHIAQVHDFGLEDGSYYIAMELVRGPDLKRIINACRELGRRIPVPVAVRVMAHVLGALHYAHQATNDKGEPLHVVHRDVSPQNVLISQDGVVKLVDFGIAKAADTSHQTEAGVVKGKFAYLAPEQLGQDPLDGRCDLFAAGLVLHELLTLERVYAGEGPTVLRAVMAANVPPVRQMRADVPPELEEALGWSLQKDRDRRPKDCRAMQHELEQLLVNWGKSIPDDEIAQFIRTLEVDWGKPLSALGTGSLSGPKSVSSVSIDIDVTPSRPPPARIRTEQVPELQEPEPLPLTAKRAESGKHRPIADEDESTVAPQPLTKRSGEMPRLARPISEPTIQAAPTPLTKKSSPGFNARPPTPASLRPIEGPVGRSTLMANEAAPSSNRGLMIGLVAALVLAAAGFFGVKFFFGAEPQKAPVHVGP
ncbi:MAG: serine/threonine protein kinase [Deltaproteobacteria bacterium]|nr:serine/threonine protein kinase [Deltaproteobacteria bacterium]